MRFFFLQPWGWARRPVRISPTANSQQLQSTNDQNLKHDEIEHYYGMMTAHARKSFSNNLQSYHSADPFT